MLLHALGDVLGYKNGEWEFNFGKKNATPELWEEFVNEFIQLGGINGIDISNWNISDDTILHEAVAKSMLKYDGVFDDKFINIVRKYFISAKDRMIRDDLLDKNRAAGITTMKSIEKFRYNIDERLEKYNPNGGGNGCAMRTLCIGLALHKESELDKLIEVSLLTSKMTHNSPIGYLAGVNAAYFASLAIRDVDIKKWGIMWVDLLSSDRIRKYIGCNNIDESNDYNVYMKYWKKYLELRFPDGKLYTARAQYNLSYRTRFYHENFTEPGKGGQLGASGYCAMIMAYDTLVDCGNNFERLIFYGILHIGDSDTIGSIAGGLYGCINGFGDVPERLINMIEDKDILIDLGEKMFEKYK